MAFRKIAAIVFVRQMLIQSLVGNFVMVAELLYEKIAIKWSILECGKYRGKITAQLIQILVKNNTFKVELNSTVRVREREREHNGGEREKKTHKIALIHETTLKSIRIIRC